jgi:hypothetical protein
LVGKAAELVRLVGGEVASVAEARDMLQLPKRHLTSRETN